MGSERKKCQVSITMYMYILLYFSFVLFFFRKGYFHLKHWLQQPLHTLIDMFNEEYLNATII